MNAQDNPLKRFQIIWWTIGVFAVFGFAALLFKLLAGEKVDVNSYDDDRRYSLRREVEREQAGYFAETKPADVLPVLANKLVASKPKAVEAATPPASDSTDNSDDEATGSEMSNEGSEDSEG